MRKYHRLLFLTACLFVLSPTYVFAISVNELSEQVEILEGNLELVEEINSELKDEVENTIKVSGYTDVEYILTDGKDPSFRMHHLSLFFQKKISNKWRFFSEIEYEDAPKYENEYGETIVVVDADGNEQTVHPFNEANGKLFVEAVNIDFLWRPSASLRFGRFFTPAGIWSIDHYPPFVATQERPRHIRRIFPQFVDGALAYGTLQFGNVFFKYDAYYGNGEGATGKGDNNSQKAIGGKTSLIIPAPPFSHLELGASVYHDTKDARHDDLEKTAFGIHGRLRIKDFSLQSEAAYAQFSPSTKGTVTGYYIQFMYELGLMGVGSRYDFYDSDRNADVDYSANSFFVNYQVSTNIVLKFEHHIISNENKEDSNKSIFSIVTYLE